MLFAAVAEMRAVEREATRLTRGARRDRTRRAGAPTLPAAPLAGAPTAPHGIEPPAAPTAEELGPPRPFDDIEQW